MGTIKGLVPSLTNDWSTTTGDEHSTDAAENEAEAQEIALKLRLV